MPVSVFTVNKELSSRKTSIFLISQSDDTREHNGKLNVVAFWLVSL